MITRLVSWLLQMMYRVGLYRKRATILLLGLDNAGKTTLLYLLKDGTMGTYVPTTRPQIKEVSIGGLLLKTWDLGGHLNIRNMWTDYYSRTNAVVFMVDSADKNRFEEAKEELMVLLGEPELKETPFLVLANKSDLVHAQSSENVRESLALDQLERHISVFSCSLLDQTGYEEAFNWLGEML